MCSISVRADAVEDVDAEALGPALAELRAALRRRRCTRRSAQLVRLRQLGAGEHRGVQRGDAIEDRRLCFRNRAKTAAGVGRSAISTAVAPTAIGKVRALPRP